MLAFSKGQLISECPFEIFVNSMPPSLWELKVLPSFCFAFKIADDVAASNIDIVMNF